MNMLPGPARVPVFGGRGTSFLDFEQEFHLQMRAMGTDPASLACFLVLRMHSAPRQVCLAAGGHFLDNQHGVARILDILRNYFAPDAADAIHQKVVRFTHFRRAEQSIDTCTAEFDLLRRTAASKLNMGPGFAEQFIPILRMKNAGLPRQAKSLLMASRPKSLMFDKVEADMRRFFGSRGSGGRQDVLLTEEAVAPSGSDEYLGACMVYEEAKNRGAGRQKKDGVP